MKLIIQWHHAQTIHCLLHVVIYSNSDFANPYELVKRYDEDQRTL